MATPTSRPQSRRTSWSSAGWRARDQSLLDAPASISSRGSAWHQRCTRLELLQLHDFGVGALELLARDMQLIRQVVASLVPQSGVDELARPNAYGPLGLRIDALLVEQHEREHLFARPGKQRQRIGRAVAETLTAATRWRRRIRPISPFQQLYFQNPAFGFQVVTLVAGRLIADGRRLEHQLAASRSSANIPGA